MRKTCYKWWCPELRSSFYLASSCWFSAAVRELSMFNQGLQADSGHMWDSIAMVAVVFISDHCQSKDGCICLILSVSGHCIYQLLLLKADSHISCSLSRCVQNQCHSIRQCMHACMPAQCMHVCPVHACPVHTCLLCACWQHKSAACLPGYI